MNNIVSFPSISRGSGCIDVRRIQKNDPSIQLTNDLISEAESEFEVNVVVDHSGDPIKDLEDINRIVTFLTERKRYRDLMLFVCGINFGLRVSDLMQLRFAHLIDEKLTFRRTFALLEKKTSTTRKHARNRYITINEAVTSVVILYLQNTENIKLDDYMFRSESNRGSNVNAPLSRKSVERILKGIANDLGLTMHISTHSLRKTFGYQQMAMSNHDPRKLLLLQKMFGHSTSAQTLDYIGLTKEEIEGAYLDLNLGQRKDYRIFGTIREEAM